jgi:sulfur carrier protein ThiS
MRVSVVFFGDLARLKPPEWKGKRGTVELPEGSTIGDLADRLGIGEEPCVIMLNDAQHHRAAELHEGDTVTFLPPIAGGSAPYCWPVSAISHSCRGRRCSASILLRW